MPGPDRSLCPDRSTWPATSTSTSRTRTTSDPPCNPGTCTRHRPGVRNPGCCAAPSTRPRRGQNLVATLTGWIDGDGRTRLTSRAIARDPVTLGPAQMSRLTFANPRVRNLLGLRNLEIRDLEESSLDTVILGEPHCCSRREGSFRSRASSRARVDPGAARLLGVTTFLNGRAGLGPDIYSAVRQALNNRRESTSFPPPADRQGQAGRARLPGRERPQGGRDHHDLGRQHHQAPPVRDRPKRRSGGCRLLPGRHECASR